MYRTRSSIDIDKSIWSMTKLHEASPWEVLNWRFEPHRVRIFFSNIFVGCLNFYVIWSTNPVRVDSLNINTFEEKRTPRSTAHTVSSIFQICSKNYLQRSYIIVLFDAIPLNSVFLVARWSVLVYCNDLPFNWNKWRDPSLNHFEYPAIGWVLNNHSTGVSDSSSDSRQV